jgi:hypothetical protein
VAVEIKQTGRVLGKSLHRLDSIKKTRQAVILFEVDNEVGD